MKKALRYLLFTLCTVALLAAAAATFITVKGVPVYDYQLPAEIADLKAPRDSAHVARGAKIATLLCNECHKDFKTGKLTGHIMSDMPKEFGTIASLNITQDSVHGIGSWTDGDIYYYLRRSVRKDGHYNPIMGGLNLMADDDVLSIIAWLRSDAPSLAPAAEEYPTYPPNFLVTLLCNTVFKPHPLPASPIALPDTSNKVALGKYLADDLCACYACHSADFKTMDTAVPSHSEGYYGGGNPMLNYEGELVPSANLTMDKETGLGNWTAAQFREAVRFGKNPKGGPLYYPMFPHTTLTDTEVDAIWAFLQTVPVLKNPVKRYREGEE